MTATVHIYNDAYDETLRKMYNSTHTISANGFLSINVGDMENYIWNTYDSTGGQIRFSVSVTSQSYTKTAEVIFALTTDMELPKTISYKFI